MRTKMGMEKERNPVKWFEEKMESGIGYMFGIGEHIFEYICFHFVCIGGSCLCFGKDLRLFPCAHALYS